LQKLIADLAPLDPIIVSGFAYGVDIVAHQAAIENNLQTIAVVAQGLNQIYPKSHQKFVNRIKENGGFMTEFWSSSVTDKMHFVRRNRIVAGISEATVVIESADKGGSLITANMARDYDREVFAVPGRVSDIYSQGCNNLIKTQRAVAHQRRRSGIPPELGFNNPRPTHTKTTVCLARRRRAKSV
jgi:DNA processing protein